MVQDSARRVVSALKERGLKLAIAESVTGGSLSAAVVAVAGASAVLDEALIPYSNASKMARLGVSQATLEEYGAVSEQAAFEMCKGVRELAGADIGVSVTGIAGPDGGSDEKPVGLVWVGICADNVCVAHKLSLAGDRNTIQTRTAMYVFDIIRKYLLNIY